MLSVMISMISLLFFFLVMTKRIKFVFFFAHGLASHDASGEKPGV